jgi:hypothetical protein
MNGDGGGVGLVIVAVLDQGGYITGPLHAVDDVTINDRPLTEIEPHWPDCGHRFSPCW